MQEDQALPEELIEPAAEPVAENLPTAETKIAELEAALEEAKASVLYIKAEGENIRRRAMDDIDKARKFALEKFSNELLAVKDSLDAALLIEATDVQSYKDGVEITVKQLAGVFDKFFDGYQIIFHLLVAFGMSRSSPT